MSPLGSRSQAPSSTGVIGTKRNYVSHDLAKNEGERKRHSMEVVMSTRTSSGQSSSKACALKEASNTEIKKGQPCQEIVTYKAQGAHILNFLKQLPSQSVLCATNSLREIAILMKDEHYGSGNATTFINACGIGTTTHLLRSNDKNSSLQEQGMRVFQNLLYAKTGTAEGQRLRHCLAMTGVVQLIVGAMNRFSDLESIQVSGCGALRNLSSGPVQVSDAVIRSGALASIGAAMKKFSLCRDIQLWGCKTVLNIVLAYPTESRKAIWNAKCVSPIACAMENFQDDSEIQIYARQALHGLFNEKAG